MYCVFFFSSRRRHTRCALVTGVQTCALPICPCCRPSPGEGAKPRRTASWIYPGIHECREYWPSCMRWTEQERQTNIMFATHCISVGSDPSMRADPRQARPRLSVGFILARRFTLCRSEEHTSELQSLMRSSYAVFCLK